MLRSTTLVVALFAAAPAGAVTVPHIFGDHMVLQAGRPVPVWGKGEPGERVSVAIGDARATTMVGPDRRWRVDLPRLAASDRPATMTIDGNNRIVITDVLVGDVWLASGQSNMEKPLGQWPGQKPTFGYEDELQRAGWPTIRLFKVANGSADRPRDDVDGEWVVCSAETLERTKFSAVAYYFARTIAWRDNAIHAVGMIESAVGGTMIEPWTPPAAFAAFPSLVPFADAARRPGAKVGDVEVSTLWNAMVAPLAPYPLAGMLWYQGESNALADDPATVYADKLRALVAGWRGAFGGGDIPFYIVQIAPYRYMERRGTTALRTDSAANIREGQAVAAATIPNSGLVVTSDLVDDLDDVHPRDKRRVGERLGRLALANDYAQPGLVTSGPIVSTVRGTGGRVTIEFTSAAGLHTADGSPPGGFELAGADGRFFVAEARVEGEHVTLAARSVPAPRRVRFGFSDTMGTNLFNGAALPAAPFAARDIE